MKPETLFDVECNVVDAAWYDYDEMMGSFEPPNPIDLGPLKPPEFRESNMGGPERGG